MPTCILNMLFLNRILFYDDLVKKTLYLYYNIIRYIKTCILIS